MTECRAEGAPSPGPQKSNNEGPGFRPAQPHGSAAFMLKDFFEYLDEVWRIPAAFVLAMLPRRYWIPLSDRFSIERFALPAGIATILAGVALGATGFFEYAERVQRSTAGMIVAVAEEQLKGQLPADPAYNFAPIGINALSFFAFLFFTPKGLLANYLVLSGFARAVSVSIAEPFGDPILTGIDSVGRRFAGGAAATRRRYQRERLEGADVPDRLYTGEWAGLEGVDLVVVAARRKPEWARGATIITEDTWYTLGEPYDMQHPDGLRTVYPLTEQKVTDVLRRGVEYRLPPLIKARRRPR